MSSTFYFILYIYIFGKENFGGTSNGLLPKPRPGKCMRALTNQFWVLDQTTDSIAVKKEGLFTVNKVLGTRDRKSVV